MSDIDTYRVIHQAKDHILRLLDGADPPKICIALGTGLGGYTGLLDNPIEIPYSSLEGLPTSTVEGHKGSLIYGLRHGVPVLLMAGRLHYYEGYSAAETALPVYIAHAMGCTSYIATNVVGSVSAEHHVGDFVFVSDHIYLLPDHPLRGTNDSRLGPRFPDMKDTYNPQLRKHLVEVATTHQLRHHEGIYICLPGPSLETPAEYQMCHRLGADVVGMSTIPEIIVARHAGMQCAVISAVSNVCYPLDRLTETTIQSVINHAEAATPGLTVLVDALVALVGQ